MTEETVPPLIRATALSWRAQAAIVLGLAVLAVGGAIVLPKLASRDAAESAAASTEAKRNHGEFRPTKEQWATLTVQPVERRIFSPQRTTEGRIAIDEDRSTPIFSPYAGRVTKLLAQTGARVQSGQVLFTIEATDMVQAQNDFLAATATLNKARSQLKLAQSTEQRQHALYDAKGAALKDWQQAQADLVSAQNDARAAEVALEAVRNRLRILGKTDEEIKVFEAKGTINPETPISTPIGGLVTQRKVGPGQFLATGATDPAYVIGDLSKVWMVANVRESDAPFMKIGESVEVQVLALPGKSFNATITYVASGVDPTTRRLSVRAEVENPDGILKAEMFATFRIVTGGEEISPAVPRRAILYEGERARVWVAGNDGSIRLRPIMPGMTSDDMVQVVTGLEAGEQVVTKGSLFIDRAASGSES